MMYDKNLFLPRVHAFQSWILPPFCTKIKDPEKPIEVACEQAFGRAGNYELEGRGKSETPVSLPFPRYFFPKQRTCSQATIEDPPVRLVTLLRLKVICWKQ